jgi:hypothetical protein
VKKSECWDHVVTRAGRASTSCSCIKTKTFSTAPSSGLPVLLSRTQRASSWCQRSPTGTPFPHSSKAQSVDVEAARERGQLTIVDAAELLPGFLVDGMPDSPASSASPRTSLVRRALEGATKRCFGEEKW